MVDAFRKLMSDDNPMLNIEESTALLRAIFPGYPDLRGMRSVPDLRAFLQGLRSGGLPQREISLPTGRRDPLRRAG
jgi:hypothetical protein